MDGFLLNVLFMIVLKVLAQYAAVARIQPQGAGRSDMEVDKPTRLATNIVPSGEDSNTRVLGRCYTVRQDDEGRGRTAARLVLSELHHVQRLVNQLSPKLKEYREEEALIYALSGQETVTRRCHVSRLAPGSRWRVTCAKALAPCLRTSSTGYGKAKDVWVS